jgi:hypothetical protein
LFKPFLWIFMSAILALFWKKEENEEKYALVRHGVFFLCTSCEDQYVFQLRKIFKKKRTIYTFIFQTKWPILGHICGIVCYNMLKIWRRCIFPFQTMLPNKVHKVFVQKIIFQLLHAKMVFCATWNHYIFKQNRSCFSENS